LLKPQAMLAQEQSTQVSAI